LVDAPDNLDPQPMPPIPPAEERVSFLASTTGKIVLGVVALVVVLAILGTIAWVFVFSAPSAGLTNGVVAATVKPVSTTTSASPSTSDTASAVEPQQKPLESTFTFRNVFAPTLAVPAPASTLSSITAESSSTTKVSASSVPQDTLFLVSIQTEDGKKTATFIWNGTTYTLSEGGTIPDTPWKVLEIGESTVVMLYGDTQVTLSTGQGLSK
jgi:hypothetical protein